MATITTVAITSNPGADDTYAIGDTVTLTVTFDNTVDVNTAGGIPTLDIVIGGTTVSATYTGGTGTTDITFDYVVQAGETDADGISIPADGISLNGGTIQDGGIDATLTYASVGDDVNHLVDTTAPTAPPAAPTVAENANGGINAVEAANGADVVVNITGTGAVAGDTLTVNWGGQTVAYILTGTDITNNSATVAVPAGTLTTQGDGTFNVSAFITDIAGNAGATSSSTSVTVDTVAPTVTISDDEAGTANIAGGSVLYTFEFSEAVTGFDASDVTVANGTKGTFTAVDGDTYTLEVTPTAGFQGNMTVDVGSDAARDGTDNASTAATQSVQPVDTLAPPAPSTPDLDAGSDSGTPNTDDITNVITPTVTGTAEAGSTVTIYDTDGTTVLGTDVATGGTYSIVLASLGDGVHNLTATATDGAGNESAASPALAVTIDSTAPAAPSAPDLDAGSDSGSSDTDNLTNVTTPTVTGTAEDGSTVTIFDSNGTTVLGSGVATGGTYSITLSSLSSGAHTLTARATDVAGNVSAASTGLVVTIDTAAPAAPSAPDLDTGSDSGTSDTDDLTNVATPTVTGTAEDGSTVTIFDTDGTTELGSGVATGGAYSITLSSLSDGAHTLTAKATDPAGNESVASAGLAVTIDTTAPLAPSTPDLVIGSDSGTSNADNITSDDTPTVTGTAEAGSTVRIYDTDGTTVLGSDVATGGTYTITLASLGDGVHNLTAKATDAAGNESAASSALAVTIDTTAPAAPSTPDIDAGSDSGPSDADNVTSDDTPTVTGTAEDGSTVRIYDTDGTTVLGTGVATGGTYSITLASLSDGAHTLTAKATDAAGNESVASTGLEMTVDTVAPAAPSAPDLDTGSDSGNSGSDDLTNDDTPTVTGTAEDGSTVTIFDTDGTTVLGTDVATGGTYSITLSSLSDGAHTLTAKATDLAGNESVASTGLVVTIDTAAPAAPSTPDLADASDSGISETDNLTNDDMPTVTGTAEDGSTVTIFDTDGTTELGSATATGGTYSIALSSLSDGAHTLTAKAMDAAGNVSVASTGLEVTIDTTNPAFTSGVTASTPENTSVTTVVYDADTTDASAVTFSLGGTDAALFSIDSNTGEVRFNDSPDFENPDDDGGDNVYDIEVTATDAAGNETTQAVAIDVTDVAGPAGTTNAMWTGVHGDSYGNAGNWTPEGPPTQIATFTTNADSSYDVVLSNTQVAGQWQVANQDYTFEIQNTALTVTLSGAGLSVDPSGSATVDNNSTMVFAGTASVGGDGSNVQINNTSTINFNEASSAGNGSFENSGLISFTSGSSAGSAAIVNDNSVNFSGTSSAGSAQITTTAGAITQFLGTSNGGDAAFNTEATGLVDFSGTSFDGGQVTAGSIAGAGDYELGANTLTTGSNGATTEVSGVISGAGGALVKAGSGVFTLSGANTYSGGTTISAGTLILGNGGTTGSILGDVANNAILAFNRTDTYAFDGVISGTGLVRQDGTGTTELGGANTYSGATTINAGTLALTGSGSIENSSGVQADGTFDISGITPTTANIATLSGSGTVELGEKTLNLTNASTTFSGDITNLDGNLSVSGGTQTLTGTNSYTGTTMIGTAGQLDLSGTGSIANSSIVSIASGGVFDISATTSGASIVDLGGSGSVVLGDQTLSLTNASSETGFAGVLSGTGGLTLEGGQESLSGVNTYSGETTIDAATTLFLSGNGSIAQSSVVTANGRFDIAGITGDTVSIVSLAGSGTVDLGEKTLELTDASTVFSGDITNLDGNLSVSGGKQTLSGANSYTGTTSIASAATLALSGAGSIANSSIVAVAVGGTFDISSTTSGASIVDLSGGGDVNLGDQILSLTGASSESVFSGVLSGAGGGLSVQGGQETLSGDNSYTGATFIADGTTLFLTGGGDIAQSSDVMADGTFDISGITSNTSIMSLDGAATGTVNLGDKGLNLTSASGTFAGAIEGNAASTLTISGGTQTLTGANSFAGATTVIGTLNLDGNGSLENSSRVTANGTFDISGNNGDVSIVDLAGNGAVTLGSNTLNLTGASSAQAFGGVISGTGGLTIEGGTETLSGVNTFSGGTTIDNGATLNLTGSGSIADSASVTVNGTFNIAGRSAGDASIQTLLGDGNVTLGGKTLALTEGGSDFSGSIAGASGGLTLETGATTLSGSNTYTGATTIQGMATLELDGGGSIASSNVVTADGIFDISGNNNNVAIMSLAGSGGVNLGDNSLQVTAGDDIFSGVIAGNGSFALTGGMQTLTGINTYSGGTSIRGGGTLSIEAAANLGTGGITFNNGTLEVTNDFAIAAGVTLNPNGGKIDTNGNTITFDGEVSGDGGLAKFGGGTLVLANNNDYTGNTTVTAGTLQVGTGGASGSISNSSAVAIAGTASLAFNIGDTLTYGGTIAGAGGVQLDGDGNVVLTGTNTYTGGTTINSGTLQIGSGSAGGSIAGAVVNDSILAFNKSGSFVFANAISGSGTVEQNGPGKTILTGENTFTGVTTINSGTLQIGNGGTKGSISDTDSVVNNGTLAFAKSSNDVFDTVIEGSGGLTKSGTGTLTLTETNTYTGNTTVNLGTLLVEGSIDSNVTVTNGGTLGGGGTTGAVVVNAGGTLAPGASTDILSTGSVTFKQGATFEVEVNGLTPGTQHDQLSVDGMVRLGAATLDLDISGNPNLGDSIVIIENDGTDVVNGRFAGLGDDVAFSLGGSRYEIDYQGGDGNDVELTMVGRHLVGTTGNNTLRGSNGDDLIVGLAGRDWLRGGNGDDIVDGGRGRDKLTGGADNDIFDFDHFRDSRAKPNQFDVITDFDRSDDLIDLRGIDAKEGAGNQKFSWIGKQGFHDKKGELRYIEKANKVIVQGDVDGDGTADFQIQVNGLTKLGANDFIL